MLKMQLANEPNLKVFSTVMGCLNQNYRLTF